MESRVEGLIQQLHSITDKSVAVGFGVSGPDQARIRASQPQLCQASISGCQRATSAFQCTVC